MSNYKPKEFAEMIGASVKILQRWGRENIKIKGRERKKLRKSYKTEFFLHQNKNKSFTEQLVYADLSIIFIWHIIKNAMKKKKDLFPDMTFQNGSTRSIFRKILNFHG